MKRMLLTLSVLTALACGLPTVSYAAPEKKADKSQKAAHPIPFTGKVTAVDAAAKTFSLKGKEKDRVFSVTDQTTISKDGAPGGRKSHRLGHEVRRRVASGEGERGSQAIEGQGNEGE